jgi:hypothetical protein
MPFLIVKILRCLALGFLAAGRLAIAAAPDENPDAVYFPMEVGEERISDVVLMSTLGKVEKAKLTVTVTETIQRGEKTYFRTKLVLDGDIARESTKLTRCDATGVYSIDESRPDSEEVTEVLLPLKPGDEQNIGLGPAKMKVRVIGLESVTIDGKTYEKCYHLQMSPPGGVFVRDMWLAPHIGAIKSETVYGDNRKMVITMREFKPGGKVAH